MDKTVLITGTSRGIGLEFAKQYAEDGWEVFATCRHPEKADDLNQLSKERSNLHVYQLDVLQNKDIQQLAKTLSGKPIDVLINNAGIFGTNRRGWDASNFFEVSDEDAMVDVFRTNTVAPLHIAKMLLPNLELGSLKVLANISSEAGSIAHVNGSVGNYAYYVSKAALNMAMKCLDQEWSPKGIRVLLFCPGWVKTDMGGKNAPVEKEVSVKKLRQLILDKVKDKKGLYFNYQGKAIPW